MITIRRKNARCTFVLNSLQYTRVADDDGAFHSNDLPLCLYGQIAYHSPQTHCSPHRLTLKDFFAIKNRTSSLSSTIENGFVEI